MQLEFFIIFSVANTTQRVWFLFSASYEKILLNLVTSHGVAHKVCKTMSRQYLFWIFVTGGIFLIGHSLLQIRKADSILHNRIWPKSSGLRLHYMQCNLKRIIFNNWKFASFSISISVANSHRGIFLNLSGGGNSVNFPNILWIWPYVEGSQFQHGSFGGRQRCYNVVLNSSSES